SSACEFIPWSGKGWRYTDDPGSSMNCGSAMSRSFHFADVPQIEVAADVLQDAARAIEAGVPFRAAGYRAPRELELADAFLDRHAETHRGGDRFSKQFPAACGIAVEAFAHALQAKRDRQRQRHAPRYELEPPQQHVRR